MVHMCFIIARAEKQKLRPVPPAVILKSEEQLTQLSLVGEITMDRSVYPDTKDDRKVKGPVARFIVTRSFNNA